MLPLHFSSFKHPKELDRNPTIPAAIIACIIAFFRQRSRTDLKNIDLPLFVKWTTAAAAESAKIFSMTIAVPTEHTASSPGYRPRSLQRSIRIDSSAGISPPTCLRVKVPIFFPFLLLLEILLQNCQQLMAHEVQLYPRIVRFFFIVILFFCYSKSFQIFLPRVCRQINCIVLHRRQPEGSQNVSPSSRLRRKKGCGVRGGSRQ